MSVKNALHSFSDLKNHTNINGRKCSYDISKLVESMINASKTT